MGFKPAEEERCCGYRSGGDEWEVLELGSVAGSIRGEDENEDAENCLSVPLEIEIGSLIDANYFACPSPPPEYATDPVFAEPVDDGSGVRNPEENKTLGIDEAVKGEEKVYNNNNNNLISALPGEEKGNNNNNNNNMISALPAVAGGHTGPYVIEGLCIIRPLVVREVALLRVDSASSFSSWRAGKGEKCSEPEGAEGLKALTAEDRGQNRQVVCRGGGEGKCKVSLNFLNRFKTWRKQVGMLPSFGIAAAAVMGLLILGRRFYGARFGRNRNQRQLIRFQIYGDNSKISRMMSETARLNEAFSGAKGGLGMGVVPVVTAQISFGGYCDGL